jgi:hypothetical protein
LKQVYFAFVQSRILYGIELYDNTCSSHFDKLSKLNNKLLRILQNRQLSVPVEELYAKCVNHFISNGNAVFFLATLDISKAFDRVNHPKFLKSLLKAGVPICIVHTVSNWYSQLSAVVRWNSTTSAPFIVNSGVRQGSILSPSILFLLTYLL